MSRLEWSKLLNGNRMRPSKTLYVKKHRNEFDKDYERIIYSSSLRRLQDKAQVFPLQENDFTRTRLTHSLEVASLGSSIAWEIGVWLLEEKQEFTDLWQAKELASLVEVTCLVHDLGNPPFGHYGEDVIRNWFDRWFDSKAFEKIQKSYSSQHGKLTKQQKNDFRLFEGNAQAIRILTKLQFLNDEYGANFTLGSLATLMKYPWASDDAKAEKKKKFGFFHSESAIFEKLQVDVGIGGRRRHPATYLLEAADDIAYLTADIEDGVKKKAVPWEQVYFEKIRGFMQSRYPERCKTLEELRLTALSNKVPDQSLVNVQNFKVIAQGIMIDAVVQAFKDNYDSIMEGHFEGDLLGCSSANDLKERLFDIEVEYCFKNAEVLALELVGDRVLTELLDLFVDAIVSIEKKPKAKLREEKIFHLISSNFRHIQTLKDGVPQVDPHELSLYNRLQLITDFISGMTDSYAVNLHRQLLGVKLP